MVEDEWDFERMAREDAEIQDQTYEFQGTGSLEFYGTEEWRDEYDGKDEREIESKVYSGSSGDGEKVTADKDPHDYASM